MRTATILVLLGALLAATAAGKEDAQKEKRSVTDLVKALKKGDEEARADAAREIGERGIKATRAANVLRKMMLTETGDVLMATADALEKTGAKMAKTVEKLTAQLTAPEPAARARAAWALALIPTAADVAPALAPLVEEQDAWVRLCAACALLRFDHEANRMAKIVTEALGHAEERVRRRAIRGLRYLPGEYEPAIEALAKIVPKGGPEAFLASDTLVALGPRAESALPTLKPLLDSADVPLACAAARAFGSLGPAVVTYVPDLLDRMLRIGPRMVVANVALVAMEESAVPALVKALDEGDTIRQTRAAMILGQLGPKAAPAVPVLIRLIPRPRPRSRLYDDLSYLQAAVIRTLGRIGPAAEPALPALDALARTDPGEKFQAEAQTAIVLIRATK